MTQKAHLHLIKWAVARGYSFMVYGEGEYDGVHSTYKAIKDNVEACDMGEMVLVTPSKKQVGKWRRLAAFAYIFDNNQDPADIIFDRECNDIADEWDREYCEHSHALYPLPCGGWDGGRRHDVSQKSD